MKLKVQLFPVDETTRRALEMDNHNSHLELTLTASGELKLVPYDAQTSNLSNSQKWNQDSVLIGSPPIFRLRYGWFGKGEERNNTNNGIGIGGSVGIGLSTLEWWVPLHVISRFHTAVILLMLQLLPTLTKIIMPKIMDSIPPPFSLQFMMHRKHKSREPEEPKECEFDENHIPAPKDLTSLTDVYWPESLRHND
ncbi:unnamed protein product [Lactuca virosa]|uniref:Uncharacterized protein n=1 Tax=Lactuca virosa TaxID=75947 RepID=A0AAU9NTM9_9ASTR|nr:unnamed protein product [Lactuca virosa]